MRYTILIIFAVYFSCAVAQKKIQIRQIPCTEQVGIGYDTVRGRIWCVGIMFEFEFSHNYPEDLRILRAGHLRTVDFGKYGGSVLLEIKKDGEYKPVSFHDKQYQNPGYYRVGTLRSLHQNNNSDILDSLEIYAKELEAKRLTYLLVGTLDEFKARHPVLTQRLLKTDSIEFKVVRRESIDAVEFIKVPVKIDLP